MALPIVQRQALIREMVAAEANGTLPEKYKPTMEKLRARGIVEPRSEVPVGGALDAAMISAGDTTLSLGRGLQDLYGRYTDNPAIRQRVAAEEAEAQRLMAPVQEQHPVASFAGSVLPYLAVPSGAAGAAGATGMRAALPIAEAALVGTALGGIDPRSTALEGGAGGLVGGLLGQALGRVMSPGVTAREGAERATEAAGRLGIRPTPAEFTGNRSLERLEKFAESIPIVGESLHNLRAGNQRIANRIAARAVGEDATAFTDEILGRARTNLGAQFDNFRPAQVELDDTFLNRLADIESTYKSAWGATDKLKGTIDDALEEVATSGSISGERFQQLRSDLASDAATAMRSQGGDRRLGQSLFDMVEAMDDALERSLGPKAREELRELRKQWRNLLMLEARGVANTSSGDVSLPTLANVLKSKDKPGFLAGRNRSDLYEAARVGQAYRPSFGTSGTGERVNTASLLQSLARAPASTAAFITGATPATYLYSRSVPYLRSDVLGPAGRAATGAAGARIGVGSGMGGGLLEWLTDEQGNER